MNIENRRDILSKEKLILHSKKSIIKIRNYISFHLCILVLLCHLPTTGSADCDTSFSAIDTLICGIYNSPSGKYRWDTSGTYLDTVTNSKGCDSIITIHIKSLNSHFTVVANACDSFVSYSGNHTWFKSDTYREVFKSASGCDSIVDYQLTINKSSHPQLKYIEPFERGPSGKWWGYEGIYLDTIPTSKGCDSVFLLVVNRAISYTPIYRIYDTACSIYTAPRTGELFDSNGIHYIDNWGGVPHYLHLTLNKSDTSVTQIGSLLKANMNDALYQWLECKNGYQEIFGATEQSLSTKRAGSYAVAINYKGCVDTSGCHQVLDRGIYPNPTSGPITIDLGMPKPNVTIEISDALGRTLERKDYGSTSIVYDKIYGRPGIYFIEVFSNSARFWVVKVLKE